ncbi:hypothetical protein [Methylicorpusculum sp.]|nr:hypothetical protein [Methylicorpusculum sp.]MDO8843101.1 hypothetical protein [Methylicorpusculum sp.]
MKPKCENCFNLQRPLAVLRMSAVNAMVDEQAMQFMLIEENIDW